jgi:hypothetical protein
MRNKQRGITMVGWLILLIPLAVVGYAGIRLTPVYLNYMKVARTLQRVADDYRGGDVPSSETIRRSIEKHFDIESVDYPTPKDVKITRDGKAWTIQAAYDDQAPLFANLAIVVVFDKTVRIGGGSGE